MSIRIDDTKCIGCGRCASVCPGTLIAVKDGKAEMRYPRDCWGCVSCVKECPVEAIALFLGADIGGMGSTMTVEQEQDVLHWKVHKYDGTQIVIDIDRRDANRY